MKVLFHRRYKQFTGGNLKLYHYFNHVNALSGWSSNIYFTPDSVFDGDTPWPDADRYRVEKWDPESADVVFMEGMDWADIDASKLQASGKPILNLIQHTQHGDPRNPRYEYLSHRAVRICVSQQVTQALERTGVVNGPIITIPNGLDYSELPSCIEDNNKDIDLLIVGTKNWRFCRRLEVLVRLWQLISRSRIRVEVRRTATIRSRFLEEIARARVCVFLPLSEEGFFLPALEAMHLKTLVVVPDCVGNRDFCIDGANCFRPSYTYRTVMGALRKAMSQSPQARGRMLEEAVKTTMRHTLQGERERFFDVLKGISELWHNTQAAHVS